MQMKLLETELPVDLQIAFCEYCCVFLYTFVNVDERDEIVHLLNEKTFLLSNFYAFFTVYNVDFFV